MNLEGQLVSVVTTGDDAGLWGAPELLFGQSFVGAAGVFRSFDVAPDGRFVAMRLAEETADTSDQVRPDIVLVQNWFEELTRLVPVD